MGKNDLALGLELRQIFCTLHFIRQFGCGGSGLKLPVIATQTQNILNGNIVEAFLAIYAPAPIKIKQIMS